jgi:DNA/RNA endonuclease G (NUC1)
MLTVLSTNTHSYLSCDVQHQCYEPICFYQDFDNNGDFWNRLEIYCRELTKKFNDIYVVSGPLWAPDTDAKEDEEKAESDNPDDKKKKKRRRRKRISHYVRLYLSRQCQSLYYKVRSVQVIGENEVAVPTHLYKVVVAEDAQNLARPAVAAFVVPNKPIPRKDELIHYKYYHCLTATLSYYSTWNAFITFFITDRVPLDVLEKRVGYKFFHKLRETAVDDLVGMDGLDNRYHCIVRVYVAFID